MDDSLRLSRLFGHVFTKLDELSHSAALSLLCRALIEPTRDILLVVRNPLRKMAVFSMRTGAGVPFLATKRTLGRSCRGMF